jgi:hypothetical protein
VYSNCTDSVCLVVAAATDHPEAGCGRVCTWQEWTQSAFWTPKGIQVEAPVLQNMPRLPAPLGTLVYTNPYFRSLPLLERLTALPLLPALLEYNADERTYADYDRMTARELLRGTFGVAPSLYDEFLGPMLLLLMFAPGETLSAAAALDVLYTYVLAHQPDFDVRWCRGTVSVPRLVCPSSYHEP